MTERITRPVLPNEHGAWVVLFVPMAVAVTVTGTFPFRSFLLVISVFCVFLGHVPVRTLLLHGILDRRHDAQFRRAGVWSAIYLFGAVAAAMPLLFQGFWLLLPMAATGAGMFLGNFFLGRRSAQNIRGDLLAVSGLTLGAPAVFYVTTGSVGGVGLELWLFNFLFFGCSVFYVHMKVAAAAKKVATMSIGEKVSTGRLTLIYHVIVILIISFMVLSQFVPALMFLTFAPMTVHAVWGTFRLSGKVHFQNLGLLLLGQSLVFGLLLIMIQNRS